MAKNKIELEFEGLEDYIKKFEHLSIELRNLAEEVLLETGKKYTQDTISAIASGNLPRQGKYSKGWTKQSVIIPKVEWSGAVATMDVGFDKNKQGAGGFLITGTPKMRPVAQLNKMYTGKTYISTRKREMTKKFKTKAEKLLKG